MERTRKKKKKGKVIVGKVTVKVDEEKAEKKAEKAEKKAEKKVKIWWGAVGVVPVEVPCGKLLSLCLGFLLLLMNPFFLSFFLNCFLLVSELLVTASLPCS